MNYRVILKALHSKISHYYVFPQLRQDFLFFSTTDLNVFQLELDWLTKTSTANTACFLSSGQPNILKQLPFTVQVKFQSVIE